MSVVPVSATRQVITALRDGVSVSVPKSLLNEDYLAMLGIADKTIDLRSNVYNAFPVLEKIGYYVEENLSTEPEDLSSAAWLKTRSSVAANAIAAPDGTTTADKLIEDATASATHQISQTHNYTAGKAYTYSEFVKAGERSKVELRFTGAAFSSNQAVTFDLTAGTATVAAGAPRYRMKALGDGWFRCSVTAVADATSTATQTIRLNNGTSSSYTGDGASGLYIWGVKGNEGTSPGVYTAVSGWKDDSLPLPIVGIYSSGAGHGNSDRQIMVRSDNNGESFTSRDFLINAGLIYDGSLLDGLLVTGDKVVLKVFTIEKTSGGYTYSSLSSIVEGGVTYAIWNTLLKVGSDLYKTGYGVSGGVTQAALFKSTDGGTTFNFVSVIAAEVGVNYSEAAIVVCSDGSWLAVIRKDGFNTTRPMSYARSTDGGLSWSAPVQFDPEFINGTQPILLRLANNKLLLMAGDRVGASGILPNGLGVTGQNITGISAWLSLDETGTAWTERYMLAPMWSTDGGQPAPVQLADGRVCHLYYSAPGATNSDTGLEPGIYAGLFVPSQMI